MVKKFALSLVFLALIISSVSAIDTEIKVKTIPDHKASIFVYPADSVTSINSFHIIADSTGELSVTHSSEHSSIDVLVKITKDGNKIFIEKFAGYPAGKPIYIRMDYTEVNGDYDPSKVAAATPSASPTPTDSPTAEAQEDVAIDEQEEPSSQITGEVIADTNSSSKAFYFVIVVGILGAIVIVLLIIKRFVTPSLNTNADNASNQAMLRSLEREERRIKEMERKIINSEKELGSIKNQDKIKATEKKLEEDRRELERLKRGTDTSGNVFTKLFRGGANTPQPPVKNTQPSQKAGAFQRKTPSFQKTNTTPLDNLFQKNNVDEQDSVKPKDEDI